MTSVEERSALTKKPSLFVLIAISWIAPMGINIFLPSIPTIEKALNAPYATVTLLIALYMASMAICQLILGSLSDRFGRRPVVLIGLTVATLAGIVCAFANSIEVLIAARMVQGAGACTGIVLARAIVRDVYDRDQSASMLGYVTMGMALAPMISPLLGGILDDAYGWRMSFYVLTTTTALVGLFAFFALPETAPLTRGQTLKDLIFDFLSLLQIREFWLYVLTIALTGGVYFSFLGGAPLISSEVLGLSATDYGALFVFVALGYIFGNFLSGRFAGRMGVKWMAQTGCLISVASTGVMAVCYLVFGMTVIGLFGPVFILGIANGMTMPSATAGAVSVRPKLAGAASGLGGSIQIGFGALMTFVCGMAVDQPVGPANPAPLVIICFVLAVAALFAILPTPKEESS